MSLTQQTLEHLLIGLVVNQIVLFEDREHLHVMLSEKGDYENTAILTVQATDDGLVVDIVGPSVPESSSGPISQVKPGERRRQAAREAHWQQFMAGAPSDTAHIFWNYDGRKNTLCGKRYHTFGLTLIGARKGQPRCKMCQRVVNSVRKAARDE